MISQKTHLRPHLDTPPKRPKNKKSHPKVGIEAHRSIGIPLQNIYRTTNEHEQQRELFWTRQDTPDPDYLHLELHNEAPKPPSLGTHMNNQATTRTTAPSQLPGAATIPRLVTH